MASKSFTSKGGWFTMQLPEDWSEYDNEEAGTYAFFNSKSWTGNLRITPIRNSNPASNIAEGVLSSEHKQNKNAEFKDLGQFRVVYYKKNIDQDGEKLINYYWVAGKQNMAFICSFTINYDMQNTDRNRNELESVEKMILGIVIL